MFKENRHACQTAKHAREIRGQVRPSRLQEAPRCGGRKSLLLRGAPSLPTPPPCCCVGIDASLPSPRSWMCRAEQQALAEPGLGIRDGISMWPCCFWPRVGREPERPLVAPFPSLFALISSPWNILHTDASAVQPCQTPHLVLIPRKQLSCEC